jgi:hypothetical protein
MRCTKCGFISFDFNQVCPKCSRELGDEQKRLNLPSFRPEPPQLLGRLIGEGSDAEFDIGAEPDITIIGGPADQEIDTGLETSFVDLEENAFSYVGEEDNDVIALEPEESEPSPSRAETHFEDFNLDLDIPVEEPETALKPAVENGEELLDLEIGEDLFIGSGENDSSVIEEPSNKDLSGKEGLYEIEESFDLDNLSFEDLDLEGPQVSEQVIELHDIHQPEGSLSPEQKALKELLQEGNPEGLTREIDMKKFRKDPEKNQ